MFTNPSVYEQGHLPSVWELGTKGEPWLSREMRAELEKHWHWVGGMLDDNYCARLSTEDVVL